MKSRSIIKFTHGGKRANAGRPLLPEDEVKTGHTVWLTNSQVSYAERIGGSIGAGIRRLLDAAIGKD